MGKKLRDIISRAELDVSYHQMRSPSSPVGDHSAAEIESAWIAAHKNSDVSHSSKFARVASITSTFHPSVLCRSTGDVVRRHPLARLSDSASPRQSKAELYFTFAALQAEYSLTRLPFFSPIGVPALLVPDAT